MPTNDYLPFCNTDTGTNLETQSAYLADSQRPIGHQPGVARSIFMNKTLRQVSAITSQLAQIAVDRLGSDLLDDGVLATLKASLASAFPFNPVNLPMSFQKYLTGSGTYYLPYQFLVATTANATVGATYTNNGATFTVRSTIAGGKYLLMTCTSGAPGTAGTLTKATGTGDSTIIFSQARLPVELEVEMVGGGGSGGYSGSAGSDTTFGGCTAHGGAQSGGGSANGGAGGAFSTADLGGYPGIGFAGGNGTANMTNGGGSGGSSPYGGQGGGGSGPAGLVGTSAAPNSGSGGGGSGSSNAGSAGGGAGSWLRFFILNPSASSYTYSIGTGGIGGTNGGDGIINIKERYQ